MTTRREMTAEEQSLVTHLAAFPVYAKSTVTRESAQNILLCTEGWIMAQGHQWDIKTKARGAGVYEIWLERRA